MSDYNEMIQLLSSKLPTCITEYPNGRYGLTGSIPIELTMESDSPYSVGVRVSKVWDTEQEVIDALLEIGITKFQKADCTWYRKEEQ